MSTLGRRQLILAASAAAVILATFAAGCSPGPRNTPVDSGKARDTLKAALESWKKGDPSNALEKGSPPIYVIDPDWQAGVKLTDYQILGDGEEKDAQLFARVRLVIRGPDGKDAAREVTFMVATAPNLTVARKIF
jgi:hypothetical protein